MNSLIIQETKKLIAHRYKRFRSLESAYLFGSILTESFNEKSDIDILFIVDDISNRNTLLKKIKTRRSMVGEHKLDINVVFKSEFRKLWHIYRPPTFYMWIKQKNLLLWGRDQLRTLRENDIPAESIHRRAVDLAQSSRSIYLNSKNAKFWEEKYLKWLRELTREILYVKGDHETNLNNCVLKISRISPKFHQVKLLLRKRLPMEKISEIAETLAQLAAQ